jgi:hypothetical protein
MGAKKKIGYRGHIEKGVVVLDEPLQLPEGAPVDVVPVKIKTLAERFKKIIGIARGLPKDMAENHDHYLHGRPKKR